MTYSNEIKKGDVVLLHGTGWKATILDGYKNRSIRMALVEGFFTEAGSILASDIAFVWSDHFDTWLRVETVDAHK